MDSSSQGSNFSNSLKKRGILNDVDFQAGMPTGLFLVGLILALFIYFVSRSFILSFAVAAIYFYIMQAIHKNDVHGFKVWMKCLSSNKLKWEAGRTTPIQLEIIHRRK